METQPHNDADLVAQCRGGRTEAFTPLMQRYYRPICAFILKRVGQPALVEDLAQETFLEAYRALREGRPPEQFAAWLFGIAHNRCGKWLRRKRPALFPATEPPDMVGATVAMIDELEDQQRLLARLENSLTELPEDTRTLLRMKHQQGKTCEQIAKELNRPVGTVKSQLARAYQQLRGRLSVLAPPRFAAALVGIAAGIRAPDGKEDAPDGWPSNLAHCSTRLPEPATRSRRHLPQKPPCSKSLPCVISYNTTTQAPNGLVVSA